MWKGLKHSLGGPDWGLYLVTYLKMINKGYTHGSYLWRVSRAPWSQIHRSLWWCRCRSPRCRGCADSLEKWRKLLIKKAVKRGRKSRIWNRETERDQRFISRSSRYQPLQAPNGLIIRSLVCYEFQPKRPGRNGVICTSINALKWTFFKVAFVLRSRVVIPPGRDRASELC